MLQNAWLENLEIKLKNAREENAEVFEQVEKNYSTDYKDFVDSFFKTDVLWAKKSISAFYQLEAFNHATKNESVDKKSTKILEKIPQEKSKEILEKALEKGLKILPLKLEQKEKIQRQILVLDWKKNEFNEIFEKNWDFLNDQNYPIIQDLASQKALDKSDILTIFSKYQTTKDIRLSLDWVSHSKRELVKKYFYQANSTNKEERVSSFSSEFGSDIKWLEKHFDWPVIDWVVNFVGRNFFKMKPYKKTIESKKMRLRRTFKMALLKLLRIKYSWFNVEKLLKQIDSLDDFESMFRLLQKLIEIIPENNELLEKYSVQEQVDEVEEIIIEAEWNKEKILAWEELTVKACTLINDTEQKLDKKTLDKILDDDTDIVWDEFKFRWSSEVLTKQKDSLVFKNNWWNLFDWWETQQINAWILSEKNEEQKTLEGCEKNSEEDIEVWEDELEQKYQELKDEYNKLEKKKQNIFASWEFELLDEINEDILSLMVKLEKISLLIGDE